MALIQHNLLKDGTFTHEELTKESWQRAMHNQEIASCWGHKPDDCHDPVSRHWARLRRKGWQCTEKQHAYADIEDPTWVGSRRFELVELPKVVPPPEAVEWPPAVALTPWMLSHMSGIGTEDCKDILFPRRELPKSELKPIVDKRGQYSLF